jgi:hypothetical protein
MGCSIRSLHECIVEFLFDFILDLINMALQPFLSLIKRFLTEPVNISVFADVWAVIVYILSLFYGILLVYVGLKFIVSGESPEQRENAKSSLRNVIIMMVLVQASFLLYGVLLDISAGLTKVIIKLIDSDFFKITLDNSHNFGFELILSVVYLVHLLFMVLILVLRYICVSAGVIFFTIGIFFYFVPFLNQYGRLILNGLVVLIFLPFFYSIIFLAASKITEIPAFSGFKTLVMIGGLSLAIISVLLLLLFVIVKAAVKFVLPTSKALRTVKILS